MTSTTPRKLTDLCFSKYLLQVFADVNQDANLTIMYNTLLNSKWSHMMDQTHFVTSLSRGF